MRDAVFTIASKNYLAHVRVLMASVAKHHIEADRFLVLVDEIENQFCPTTEQFAVLEARDLGIPSFRQFCFRYSIVEANTAAKPFAFQLLLARGYDRILYFDPDIVVYHPLTRVFGALSDAPVVVTPHITQPIPDDGCMPDDQEFAASGCYNLGFLGIADAPQSRRLLAWWAAKCHTQCYIEKESGLFVDQKWLDLAPCMFAPVHIITHPGCNMAYWNLHERRLSDGLVNGTDPLVFYHFSGFETDDTEALSKYQNRYRLSDRPDVQPLFRSYSDKLMSAGLCECRGWRYTYGHYSNGERIGVIARRLYPHVAHRFADPFVVGKGSYHCLLRRTRLLEKADSSFALSRGGRDSGARALNTLMRLMPRIVGPDQYARLMSYLRRTAILRNQRFLIK